LLARGYFFATPLLVSSQNKSIPTASRSNRNNQQAQYALLKQNNAVVAFSHCTALPGGEEHCSSVPIQDETTVLELATLPKKEFNELHSRLQASGPVSLPTGWRQTAPKCGKFAKQVSFICFLIFEFLHSQC